MLKIVKNIRNKWIYRSRKSLIRYWKSRGVKIGSNFQIVSKFTTEIDLTRPSLIEIGDNVFVNRGFGLFTHDWVANVFVNKYKEFLPSSGPVKIGNNVSFGINCTVLKNVTIGDNCFIAAGSLVNRDIPANSIAGGVPAKVICSLDDFFEKRKIKCVEEALVYARSIQDRYGRRPVPKDFWEEFPLFVNGADVDKYPEIPIRKQLRDGYDKYCSEHKSVFEGFEDFLHHAGIK